MIGAEYKVVTLSGSCGQYRSLFYVEIRLSLYFQDVDFLLDSVAAVESQTILAQNIKWLGSRSLETLTWGIQKLDYFKITWNVYILRYLGTLRLLLCR